LEVVFCGHVGPLWQVPLHVIAGSPKGLNPLEYARKTVYAKLVAQEFGASFFSGGGHPTGIVAPETDPGETNAKLMKQKFIDAASGRGPVVLPQTIKYTQLQINPDDSQFIEAMRFSDEELAERITRRAQPRARRTSTAALKVRPW
jgi:phage portal protein BeeE